MEMLTEHSEDGAVEISVAAIHAASSDQESFRLKALHQYAAQRLLNYIQFRTSASVGRASGVFWDLTWSYMDVIAARMEDTSSYCFTDWPEIVRAKTPLLNGWSLLSGRYSAGQVLLTFCGKIRDCSLSLSSLWGFRHNVLSEIPSEQW
jgi:hypothetical protein